MNMADENQSKELRYRDQTGVENRLNGTNYTEETSSDIAAPVRDIYYEGERNEETAAEIAAPVTEGRNVDYEGERNEETDSGQGIGFAALALSIISLFVLPILFGAAGIILGFVARRRGAESLGSWAIGIGAVSIIIGIFIMPFF
jgi:hypothetical protein